MNGNSVTDRDVIREPEGSPVTGHEAAAERAREALEHVGYRRTSDGERISVLPSTDKHHQLARDVLALAAALRRADERTAELEKALTGVLANPRWLSIGSIDNTAELRRVSRRKYEQLAVLASSADREQT